MKHLTLKYLFLFLFLGCFLMSVQAQQPETIRVRKESNLVKAYFDVTELKLLPIDRFGNPQDNRIMGFKLYVKNKRETKEFESFSSALTPEMLTYLNALKDAAKIFFTNIMVEEDESRLIKLPDVIEVWFPNPNSHQKTKKHK